MRLAFSACRYLSHHYFFFFLAFFTYAYRIPTCFVKFSFLLVFIISRFSSGLILLEYMKGFEL